MLIAGQMKCLPIDGFQERMMKSGEGKKKEERTKERGEWEEENKIRQRGRRI
jgi:hypothetical protein